jgi:hypothetical protein
LPRFQSFYFGLPLSCDDRHVPLCPAFLLGLTWNHNPPSLHLLSSWYYRYESQHLARRILFYRMKKEKEKLKSQYVHFRS